MRVEGPGYEILPEEESRFLNFDQGIIDIRVPPQSIGCAEWKPGDTYDLHLATVGRNTCDSVVLFLEQIKRRLGLILVTHADNDRKGQDLTLKMLKEEIQDPDKYRINGLIVQGDARLRADVKPKIEQNKAGLLQMELYNLLGLSLPTLTLPVIEPLEFQTNLNFGQPSAIRTLRDPRPSNLIYFSSPQLTIPIPSIGSVADSIIKKNRRY